MIIANSKKRDIKDVIWSVLTSFGYSEVEKCENFQEEAKKEKGKYFLFDENSATVINSGTVTPMSVAEAVAVGIEAAAALEIEYYYAAVEDETIMELCDFFGFEDYVEKGTQKNKFKIAKDEIEIAKGKMNDDYIELKFDFDAIYDAEEMSGADIDPLKNSGTLIFAEENGEGAAYEVAYNLRINGCIAELYTEGGSLSEAEAYAENSGISALIRCFADGQLMIKEYKNGDIVETNIGEFLGYYDEDEDDCECGCGHHHHHDGGCCQ